MARFRFRLERIRKLRKREEDTVARELGELLGRRALILREIDDYQGRRRSLMTRRGDLQTGEVHVSAVSHNALQLEAVGRGEAHLRGKLTPLEKEISRKREALLERSRKRKALDKLRERQGNEHRVEEDRQELKEADDRLRKARGMGIA
ncbi:flagellar export protein FliJ [bacterium]|nr:flagellar export protein FliJ [bacterium]